MTSSVSLHHEVTTADTAAAVGSGDLPILGTPVVVAWLEEATCAALTLEADQTSVGVRIEISHDAPSAIGERIEVSASILSRDGRLVTFSVVAHDSSGKVVATGQIRRVIVDRERFMAKLGGVTD